MKRGQGIDTHDKISVHMCKRLSRLQCTQLSRYFKKLRTLQKLRSLLSAYPEFVIPKLLHILPYCLFESVWIVAATILMTVKKMYFRFFTASSEFHGTKNVQSLLGRRSLYIIRASGGSGMRVRCLRNSLGKVAMKLLLGAPNAVAK